MGGPQAAAVGAALVLAAVLFSWLAKKRLSQKNFE
jgi:hypothetical protein